MQDNIKSTVSDYKVFSGKDDVYINKDTVFDLSGSRCERFAPSGVGRLYYVDTDGRAVPMYERLNQPFAVQRPNGNDTAVSIVAQNAPSSDPSQNKYVALMSPDNFSLCKFQNINFGGTDLRGTAFAGAMLEGASFVGADVSQTSFRGAVLTQSDLTDARFGHTNIDQVRLDRTDVLHDNVVHDVKQNTYGIEISADKIPDMYYFDIFENKHVPVLYPQTYQFGRYRYAIDCTHPDELNPTFPDLDNGLTRYIFDVRKSSGSTNSGCALQLRIHSYAFLGLNFNPLHMSKFTVNQYLRHMRGSVLHAASKQISSSAKTNNTHRLANDVADSVSPSVSRSRSVAGSAHASDVVRAARALGGPRAVSKQSVADTYVRRFYRSASVAGVALRPEKSTNRCAVVDEPQTEYVLPSQLVNTRITEQYIAAHVYSTEPPEISVPTPDLQPLLVGRPFSRKQQKKTM